MKDRIQDKGIPAEKVMVIPPWSHDDHVRFEREGKSSGPNVSFRINSSSCIRGTIALASFRHTAPSGGASEENENIVFCL